MSRAQHCEMCAGPLPWKPYRDVVDSYAVTCCTSACVERLRATWEPAPRYPVRASLWISVAIAGLTLAALA